MVQSQEQEARMNEKYGMGSVIVAKPSKSPLATREEPCTDLTCRIGTPSDAASNTQHSIRTGMEAVYTLCGVDRGVPEVWGSVFDVRDLLRSVYMLTDGKKLSQMDLDLKQRMALQTVLKMVRGTEVEKLLQSEGLI